MDPFAGEPPRDGGDAAGRALCGDRGGGAAQRGGRGGGVLRAGRCGGPGCGPWRSVRVPQDEAQYDPSLPWRSIWRSILRNADPRLMKPALIWLLKKSGAPK